MVAGRRCCGDDPFAVGAGAFRPGRSPAAGSAGWYRAAGSNFAQGVRLRHRSRGGERQRDWKSSAGGIGATVGRALVGELAEVTLLRLAARCCVVLPNASPAPGRSAGAWRSGVLWASSPRTGATSLTARCKCSTARSARPSWCTARKSRAAASGGPGAGRTCSPGSAGQQPGQASQQPGRGRGHDQPWAGSRHPAPWVFVLHRPGPGACWIGDAGDGGRTAAWSTTPGLAEQQRRRPLRWCSRTPRAQRVESSSVHDDVVPQPAGQRGAGRQPSPTRRCRCVCRIGAPGGSGASRWWSARAGRVRGGHAGWPRIWSRGGRSRAAITRRWPTSHRLCASASASASAATSITGLASPGAWCPRPETRWCSSHLSDAQGGPVLGDNDAILQRSPPRTAANPASTVPGVPGFILTRCSAQSGQPQRQCRPGHARAATRPTSVAESILALAAPSPTPGRRWRHPVAADATGAVDRHVLVILAIVSGHRTSIIWHDDPASARSWVLGHRHLRVTAPIAGHDPEQALGPAHRLCRRRHPGHARGAMLEVRAAGAGSTHRGACGGDDSG